MLVLIIIVAAVAAWWFLSSHDSAATKAALKGAKRNDEQKKVIRYFLNDGCGAKRISDAEYDQIVRKAVDSLNLKQRALNKIGLDESELQEIAPVYLEGYNFKKAYQRQRDNGMWVSSCFQCTWLFFSDKQVYFYTYTLNTDCDEKRESSEEYFYRDIVNFNQVNETEEVRVYPKGSKDGELVKVETSQFSIVVPGDKNFVAMTPSEENERAIKGMKAKLREKKNV